VNLVNDRLHHALQELERLRVAEPEAELVRCFGSARALAERSSARDGGVERNVWRKALLEALEVLRGQRVDEFLGDVDGCLYFGHVRIVGWARRECKRGNMSVPPEAQFHPPSMAYPWMRATLRDDTGHTPNGGRMKPSLLAVIVAALVVAAVFASSRLSAASTRTATSPCGNGATQYGHVKWLSREGNRYVLRFDPALWLSGITAQRAAVEDKAIRPGEAVPNDYYIVDETHRLLTYLVPAAARVTVLTTRGDPNRLGATSVSVAELVQLLRGKHPRRLRLTEPKAGFWIRIVAGSGTVAALDQQYQP
jgi:hypothetical protein